MEERLLIVVRQKLMVGVKENGRTAHLIQVGPQLVQVAGPTSRQKHQAPFGMEDKGFSVTHRSFPSTDSRGHQPY
jgi:hypothetical protein